MQLPHAIQSYALIYVVCDRLLRKLLVYETIHDTVQ